MKFHKIIGIAGKAGSGRKTLAQALEHPVGPYIIWRARFSAPPAWRPEAILLLLLIDEVLVVPDLSKESEAAWVRENGGLVIHVTRPGHDEISRSGIKVKHNDAEMFNCDTLQQFQYVVAQLFRANTLTRGM